MASTVHQIITEKFLSALDAGKVAPWACPWHIEGLKNAISKKLYRGVNVLLLSLLGQDDWFLTYKQAKSLGGNVKKGAKGIPITFYNVVDSKTQVDAKGKPKQVRFLRYYTVFNASDCENLEWVRPIVNTIEFVPSERAESIATSFLSLDSAKMPACPISYGGSRACYSPAIHAIQMPRKETFKSIGFYYKTLFHECGHALHGVTETEKLSASFGSEPYAKEELTAEIFASFCLNHCGMLEADLFDNSTAYLANWRKALSADHSLIISAASKAQRRMEYLLGLTLGNEDSGDTNGKVE